MDRYGQPQAGARGVCARPLGLSTPMGNNAWPGRPRGFKAGCRAGSPGRGHGCRRLFGRMPSPQGAGQRSRPKRSEGGEAWRDRRGHGPVPPNHPSGVLDGGGVAAQLAKPLPRRRPARSGQKATTTLAAPTWPATGEGRRAQRRAKLAEPAVRSAGPRRAREMGDERAAPGTPPRGDGGGSTLPGSGRRAVLARGPDKTSSQALKMQAGPGAEGKERSVAETGGGAKARDGRSTTRRAEWSVADDRRREDQPQTRATRPEQPAPPEGGRGGNLSPQVLAAARGWRGGLAAPGGAGARVAPDRGGARGWRATPGQPEGCGRGSPRRGVGGANPHQVLAGGRGLPAGHTRPVVRYRQGLFWLAARCVCARPDGASRLAVATSSAVQSRQDSRGPVQGCTPR